MNRRELLAGVGSVGVLGGAGAVLLGGRSGSPPERTANGEDDSGPITVDAIDAPGSTADSIVVPPEGADATVVTFFSTTCDPCHQELASVSEARGRLRTEYGDGVRFLSVTFQPPDVVSDGSLRDWWANHGGDWPVAFDPDSQLKDRYSPLGMPSTTVLDEGGAKRWMNTGPHGVDKIVGEIRPVLESAGGE